MTTTTPSTPYAQYLEIARDAALAGGKILSDHWGNLKQVEEKGRLGDLVTEADRAAEAAVLDWLHQHCPEIGIVAEESGLIGNQEGDMLWAIDPLDGTTNFAHQYPFSAVSIGLLINGNPEVGVIYDPFHQDLFCAATGLGATCNDEPIQVSTVDRLDHSLLVTGFAYDRRETSDNNYAEFCYLTHLTQGVRRSGSASIDLAYVACGRLDGYWERGLSVWDIAAGVVLVREAGGTVTNYDGSPVNILSGRLLATNTHLHAELSDALQTVPPIEVWDLPPHKRGGRMARRT
jgi:myo-inositol-1(or 4)-monophosphatase